MIKYPTYARHPPPPLGVNIDRCIISWLKLVGLKKCCIYCCKLNKSIYYRATPDSCCWKLLSFYHIGINCNKYQQCKNKIQIVHWPILKQFTALTNKKRYLINLSDSNLLCLTQFGKGLYYIPHFTNIPPYYRLLQ
jgi:hypothetical protein